MRILTRLVPATRRQAVAVGVETPQAKLQGRKIRPQAIHQQAVEAEAAVKRN
jgi:hypothetical protein